MSPLAVAIVGCGVISHIHAAAIVRHPRLQIAAIVDPDPSAAAALAGTIVGLGRPAPPTFADLATALAQSTVDIVVICTPSGTHADIAEMAIVAAIVVALFLLKVTGDSMKRVMRFGVGSRIQRLLSGPIAIPAGPFK